MKLVAVTLLIPLAVGSASLDAQNLLAGEADFCARAQAFMAQTELPIANRTHTDYAAFVDSKATVTPLETQQYTSNPLSENNGLDTVMSCKMKSAGAIAAAYPVVGDQPASAGQDQSCERLGRAMIEAAVVTIGAAPLAFDPAAIVVEDEALTFMGPMWLSDWPFQSAYVDEDQLHLRSRALYVPWSIFIPAPAAFKGVYYCHLVAPEYLEALLRGNAQAPARADSE